MSVPIKSPCDFLYYTDIISRTVSQIIV